MIVLLVEIGGATFAIDAAKIVEVAPLVATREIPGSAASARGLVVFRGAITPVFDLGVVLVGVPTADRLGARIVVHQSKTADRTSRTIGLLVPGIGEVMHVDLADVNRSAARIRLNKSSYLETTLKIGDSIVPLIDLDAMIAEEALFTAEDGGVPG